MSDSQPNYPQQPEDAPSGGMAVLGFLFPVVGLILYLVWKDQTPLKAQSAGKGALISTILGAVVGIIWSIVAYNQMMSVLRMFP